MGATGTENTDASFSECLPHCKICTADFPKNYIIIFFSIKRKSKFEVVTAVFLNTQLLLNVIPSHWESIESSESSSLRRKILNH